MVHHRVTKATLTQKSDIVTFQNVDKRHFWRLSFCIFKNIFLIIWYSIQKSDIEQNKKGYSLSISLILGSIIFVVGKSPMDIMEPILL